MKNLTIALLILVSFLVFACFYSIHSYASNEVSISKLQSDDDLSRFEIIDTNNGNKFAVLFEDDLDQVVRESTRHLNRIYQL